MSQLGFILATVLVLTVSSKFSTAFLPPRPTASLFLSSTCLASVLGDEHGNVDPSKDHPNGNNTTTRDFKISPGDMVSVKRKKGSKFKEEIADNRDNLPFVVKLTTPDPYTRLEIKKAKAQQATREDRKTRTGPSNMNIAASIFIANSDNEELFPILGEFQLDKQTTSGDILQLGEKQFKVLKARCQYKYVGGQKFAMVRKILEVKELARSLAEETIAKQFQASGDDMMPDLE